MAIITGNDSQLSGHATDRRRSREKRRFDRLPPVLVVMLAVPMHHTRMRIEFPNQNIHCRDQAADTARGRCRIGCADPI